MFYHQTWPNSSLGSKGLKGKNISSSYFNRFLITHTRYLPFSLCHRWRETSSVNSIDCLSVPIRVVHGRTRLRQGEVRIVRKDDWSVEVYGPLSTYLYHWCVSVLEGIWRGTWRGSLVWSRRRLRTKESNWPISKEETGRVSGIWKWKDRGKC